MSAWEPISSSRSGALSMPKLKLVRGVSVNFLFSPTLFTLLDRAFPFGPSLTERADCGVVKLKGE